MKWTKCWTGKHVPGELYGWITIQISIHEVISIPVFYCMSCGEQVRMSLSSNIVFYAKNQDHMMWTDVVRFGEQ